MIRRLTVLLLMAAMILTFAACGGSDSKETKKDSASEGTTAAPAGAFTGDTYVYSGGDFAIKTPDLPADYPLIPIDTFTEVFNTKFGTGAGYFDTKTTYAEVAAAFGDEGILMDGIEYEGYTYYSWVSDEDINDELKVSILVTFKNNGGELTYYAYTANGITK